MIYDDGHKNKNTRPIRYKVDENGCWICISHAKDKDGYPKLVRNYKTLRMNRYIYEHYYNRKIKEGHFIMHSFDNPSCINPKHLSEGTHTDNVRDMHSKGRAGTAKINFDIADEIRIKHRNGKTIKELCGEYGLHNTTIGKIINSKIWIRRD